MRLDDGVAGRVRATSHVDVSCSFGELGRVPGRLGRREGGRERTADVARPLLKPVQSMNGSRAASSQRCDVSAATKSSRPARTVGGLGAIDSRAWYGWNRDLELVAVVSRRLQGGQSGFASRSQGAGPTWVSDPWEVWDCRRCSPASFWHTVHTAAPHRTSLLSQALRAPSPGIPTLTLRT